MRYETVFTGGIFHVPSMIRWVVLFPHDLTISQSTLRIQDRGVMLQISSFLV